MNQMNITKKFVRIGFRFIINSFIDGSSKSLENIFQ